MAYTEREREKENYIADRCWLFKGSNSCLAIYSQSHRPAMGFNLYGLKRRETEKRGREKKVPGSKSCSGLKVFRYRASRLLYRLPLEL